MPALPKVLERTHGMDGTMTKRNLFFACALAGCATGTGGLSAPTPEVARGVEGTERVVQRGREQAATVAAPVAVVFTALGAVYDDLELNVTDRVPREGRITAERRRLVRLAGRRASDYVDCGSTFSGPVADDAEVLLGVASVVAPGDGASVLSTRVDAEARVRGNMEGVRECTSTGRLERMILENVLAKISGA